MNQIIIDQFKLLIDQVNNEFIDAKERKDTKEITKHQFRLQSLKKSLQVIKKLDFEIKKSSDVANIPGIGKGTLIRIDEILQTGRLEEIKKTTKNDTLVSINELKRIHGIGDEKARILVTKFGIKSIAELKVAYNKKLIDLDNTTKLGLKYYDLLSTDIPRAEMIKTEKYLLNVASKVDNNLLLTVCGSYRRGRPSSGDIDVLLAHPDLKTERKMLNDEHHYFNSFIDKLVDDKFLLDHLTEKYSIKYMGFSKLKSFPVRRIDIRFIPYESLHSAMLYFTGPRDLNIMMRREAIKRDMILNEYGLFKEKDGKLTSVKISSEEDIFKKLGMDYMTPEERDKFEVAKKR